MSQGTSGQPMGSGQFWHIRVVLVKLETFLLKSGKQQRISVTYGLILLTFTWSNGSTSALSKCMKIA